MLGFLSDDISNLHFLFVQSVTWTCYFYSPFFTNITITTRSVFIIRITFLHMDRLYFSTWYVPYLLVLYILLEKNKTL